VILADTSIWVDHLRSGSPELAALLRSNRICVHDFVIGELACGNLRNRREVLELLQSLFRLGSATNEEALFFIEQQQLMARGIGYIDVHLLAASALHGVQLWTKDKRLKTVAEEIGSAYAGSAH
jgi:predicted nucleic acid-binding protein